MRISRGHTAVFRPRLAEVIDLHQPLAVFTSRLPWARIEAVLAPHFVCRVRNGWALEQDDLFGSSLQIAGTGVAGAGRSRPLRGTGQNKLLGNCSRMALVAYGHTIEVVYVAIVRKIDIQLVFELPIQIVTE